MKSFSEELRAQVRKRWKEESLARIQKCLRSLSEEQVWHRFNSHTLTVGNILLHLRGNIRQWIVCGLGGEPDRRERDAEFSADRVSSKDELFRELTDTVSRAIEVVDSIPEKEWLETRTIQGMQETPLSAVIHVTEHLSYHTGEITYITKLLLDIDTKYYDSAKLRAKNG